MSAPLGPAGFARRVAVSRETLARLERYGELLAKWRRRLNLVSDRSMSQLWRRHMLDSAQLFPLLPPGATSLVDLGSGAGFPGLVLAIMGAPGVHLIEASRRKCAFLREAARATDTPVRVHAARIEALAGWRVDVITARALAPLSELLDMAYPFVGPSTCCIFLKGAGIEAELEQARRRWRMKLETVASRSDPRGVIVRLCEVSHDGTDP